MKNFYKIDFYTMSDGTAYVYVYAETSKDAIELAKKNSNFCQLMNYRMVSENEVIHYHGTQYANNIKNKYS